jgi:hypothetical protein
MKVNPAELDLVNFSKAARLLGYTSSQVIYRLVEDKHLNSYRLPDSSTRKVCRNEVLGLVQLAVPKEEKPN